MFLKERQKYQHHLWSLTIEGSVHIRTLIILTFFILAPHSSAKHKTIVRTHMLMHIAYIYGSGMVNDREKERERLIRKHYTKDRHHGKNFKKPQSLNKRFLLLLFKESCDSFFATSFLQLFAKYPAPKHHQYARMYEDNN